MTVLNQPNPAKRNATQGAINEATTGSNPLNSANITPSNRCLSGPVGEDGGPVISQNRSMPPLYPGREVFRWGAAGEAVRPNNSYVTSRGADATAPKFAAFISQLNVTYTPLLNVGMRESTRCAVQPNMSTFAGDPAINGTMFIVLTSEELAVTPFNLTMANPFIYTGPALYQAG